MKYINMYLCLYNLCSISPSKLNLNFSVKLKSNTRLESKKKACDLANKLNICINFPSVVLEYIKQNYRLRSTFHCGFSLSYVYTMSFSVLYKHYVCCNLCLRDCINLRLT